MSREKQIEEMAKAKCFQEIYTDLKETPTGALNEDFTLVTMSQQFNDSFIRSVAKHLMNKSYRKASDVARKIFKTLRVLGHIDFEGNICIRKDSFEELEKKYTEEGK